MRRLSQFLTSVVVAITISTACTSTPEVSKGEFLIRGHFDNLPDSTEIQISRVEGNLGVTVARDTIFNGDFELRGEVKLEGEHKFNITGSGGGFESRYYEVWLSSGSYVEITGKTPLNGDWRVKSRSAMQRSHSRYLDANRGLNLKVGAISAEEDVLMQKVYDAMRNKKDYSQYREPVDSLRKLRKPIDSLLKIKQVEYMQCAKVDDYWIYEMEGFASMTDYATDTTLISMIRGLEARIPQSYRNTIEGKRISAYLNPPAQVKKGDLVPEVKFFDAEGREHTLSELRGKYILLDFFSRGCGPCIMALPEMQSVSRQFADKLEVVSISSDTKEMWLEFLESDQAKGSTYHHWNELVEVPQLYRAFRVRGIPGFVVIDPEGCVVKTWMGYYKGYIRKQLPKPIKTK